MKLGLKIWYGWEYLTVADNSYILAITSTTIYKSSQLKQEGERIDYYLEATPVIVNGFRTFEIDDIKSYKKAIKKYVQRY